MIVKLFNESICAVCVSIEAKQPVIIQPGCSINVECITDALVVSVNNDAISRFKSQYIINLRTKYIISGIKQGETIVIRYDLVKAETGIYYEHMVLVAVQAVCVEQDYEIIGEKRIKRKFINSKRREDYVIDPLFGGIHLVIIFGAAGIYLTYLLGWMFAVIYFPLVYCIILGVSKLGDAMLNVTIKKLADADKREKSFVKQMNDLESDEEVFYRCCDKKFITSFFQNIK